MVEEAATERLVQAPYHPYSKHLIASLPRIGAEVPKVSLPGAPPNLAAPPPGCRFHPRCPALASGTAQAAGVADACRSTDLPVIPAAAGHAAACHLVAVS